MVSQPVTVIRLELLSANQCVEQIGDDEHRHDEAEHVAAAHVRDQGTDDGAHIQSMPLTSKISRANMPMPMSTATTSMLGVLASGCDARMTIPGGGITISLRRERPPERWRGAVIRA